MATLVEVSIRQNCPLGRLRAARNLRMQTEHVVRRAEASKGHGVGASRNKQAVRGLLSQQ
jgi:hypothetical protein